MGAKSSKENRFSPLLIFHWRSKCFIATAWMKCAFSWQKHLQIIKLTIFNTCTVIIWKLGKTSTDLWNSPHSMYVFIIWKFDNLHKYHWFTRAQGHNLWPLQGHNFTTAKSNAALEINSLLQQWILHWLWIRFKFVCFQKCNKLEQSFGVWVFFSSIV